MCAAPLFRTLSGAPGKVRLPVLIFHRVSAEPDPIFPGEPCAAWFDEMLSWLKSWFEVLPLDQAVERLANGSLVSGTVAITFDDGYADNFHVALPILKKHGLSATFFVATGFLDGGRMWNDSIIELVRRAAGEVLDLANVGLGRYGIAGPAARRATIDALLSRVKYLDQDKRQDLVDRCVAATNANLPDDLMMTSAQVKELRQAGMQVGAHTVTHPILSRVSAAEARREIDGSKRALERIIGEEILLFAYPNGKPVVDYRAEHAAMVRDAGFRLAMSTAWGTAAKEDDVFQLPRFTPWNRSQLGFGLRMAQNLLRRRHERA
jgi:peptidoglycan/xylan/chitin deacetylase (PgdA/CDA1 family)